MSTALMTLTNKLAARLNMGDGSGLIETLKATAFKSERPATDDQLTALMVVANEYGLNPWTKEIYAFPDSRNGIVPVVGVDGWSRIINSHEAFDGMEFEQDDEKCTCIIFRKDRSRPIKVTEYMSECARPTMPPWKTHPKRMLRHKAMIQCSRIAFGYGGIYDQDEAERIVEATAVIDSSTGEVIPSRQAAKPTEFYPPSDFDKNLPSWTQVIESGRKTPSELIPFIESKGKPLTHTQKQTLSAIKKIDATDATPKGESPAQEPAPHTAVYIKARIESAKTMDELAEAGALIDDLPAEEQQSLVEDYKAKGESIK